MRPRNPCGYCGHHPGTLLAAYPGGTLQLDSDSLEKQSCSDLFDVFCSCICACPSVVILIKTLRMLQTTHSQAGWSFHPQVLLYGLLLPALPMLDVNDVNDLPFVVCH